MILSRGRFPSDQALFAFVVFLAMLLIALGALGASGCAAVPAAGATTGAGAAAYLGCSLRSTECVCAPAPDPRVGDLVSEVNRLSGENQRLRERLQEQRRIDEDGRKGPSWEYPRFMPDGEPMRNEDEP
jgi:hypothetical protein